jgi:hypothetical protein
MGDNKIMRGKNATKFFIMTIKGSAGNPSPCWLILIETRRESAC